MKKRIRLTESQLTKLINESIMEMLKEKYPINANSFSADNRYGNGYAHKSINMRNPKYDDISPYSETDYYSAPDRDSNLMYKDLETFNKNERKKQASADKRWMDAADKRPLHRKGSLNRA